MQGAYGKPHRGVPLLIGGILSICCCGPFVGLPVLIIAIMDLQAMNREEMDSSGRSLVIAAIVLSTISMLLCCLNFASYAMNPEASIEEWTEAMEEIQRAMDEGNLD